MSWSISCVGKPENVAARLDAHSETLKGECKSEFDAALPHLKALVLQNFAAAGHGHYQGPVEFEAAGHGYSKDGRPVYGTCSVSIKPFGKPLV